MSFYRLAALCALAATSTYSFAVDPNAEAVASYLRANLESVRFVPWFPGMQAVQPKVETAKQPLYWWKTNKVQILSGTLRDSTCLKLRTYRVKRQEAFNEGESGSIGYSTCQWASQYELRSTILNHTLPAEPRE
jgi:hypothetical protein